MSTSTSLTVTAAQAATSQQLHRHHEGDDNDDDYMQMFVALREEKRRLLDTAAAADHQLGRSKQEQEQLRQQMNNFSRRLHAVVQRMSAYDRYKRKKKTIRKHTATTQQQRESKPSDPGTQPQPSQQQLSPEWIAQKWTRISQMEAEVDECHQRLVNFDGWKRLANEMRKDVEVYKQFTNMLRGQPVETNTEEEESNQANEPQSEHEKRRNSFKEFMKEIVKQVEECRVDRKAPSQQRAHTDEQLRLTLAPQIDQQHARHVEQAEMERARLATLREQRALESKRRRESTDRLQEETNQILRRIDKRKANGAWHDEWRSRRPMIVQRRANQAVNAG